jgi:outer membrane autotransporter protein
LINIVTGNTDTGTTAELNFQITNNEAPAVYASIEKVGTAIDGENILNININNNNVNSNNQIAFYSNIGGVEIEDSSVFVDNLTIGDESGSKRNNVLFSGQYLNTINGLNIGVDGRSKQTHNITFENLNAIIVGDVSGLDDDLITIGQGLEGRTTTFYNSVSNIDNINVNYQGTMIFRGDVLNSSINLNRESVVEFGDKMDGDDIITHVDSDITVLNGSSDALIFFGDYEDEFNSNIAVNFSGSVTVQNGSNATIVVSNGSRIGYDGGGDIKFGNGDDELNSINGVNYFSSDINFGTGEDLFEISAQEFSDSIAVLTGKITNLENINITDNSYLVVTQGGSYTGNVNGDSNSTLAIGGLFGNDLDETRVEYNSPGTVDSVGVSVNGAAIFNTNGNKFGLINALDELSVHNEAIFNMQDDVTTEEVYLGGALRIGAGDVLTTAALFGEGGNLIFDVASPSSAGLLNVTDSDLILTGLDVEANITGSLALFRDGTAVKIAQGTSALTGVDGEEGQESLEVVDNSLLFSVRMMDGSQLLTPASSNDLYLVFSQDTTIEEMLTGNNKNGNNKNVGRAFDGLLGTGNTELSQIITRIDSASQSELESILESTTADVGGGIAVGSQNFVNSTLDITSQQIDIAMNSHSGVAAGDKSKGLRMWGQYFFEDAKQGFRKNIAGYDSSTSGVALGTDTTELFDNTVVGLGFSFGDTEVNSNNANSARNKIDSYQVTAYGSYSLPANYFFKAMAAYSHNEIKTSRHNVGGLDLDAQGDYNASIYTFRTDIGKDFYKGGNMRITPSFMAHYSIYNAQDYTETGAGGANLKVASQALEILEVGTNLELGWDFKLANERSFSPEIRAGYRYDLIGSNFRTRSSFAGGGSSFDTVGADPARGALTLGGGLIYQVTNQWDLSLNYEYENRQNFHSNSGFVRAAYRF